MPASFVVYFWKFYANVNDWEIKAKDLASRFAKNFKKYETNEAGKALVAAGPKVD